LRLYGTLCAPLIQVARASSGKAGRELERERERERERSLYPSRTIPRLVIAIYALYGWSTSESTRAVLNAVDHRGWPSHMAAVLCRTARHVGAHTVKENEHTYVLHAHSHTREHYSKLTLIPERFKRGRGTPRSNYQLFISLSTSAALVVSSRDRHALMYTSISHSTSAERISTTRSQKHRGEKPIMRNLLWRRVEIA